MHAESLLLRDRGEKRRRRIGRFSSDASVNERSHRPEAEWENDAMRRDGLNEIEEGGQSVTR